LPTGLSFGLTSRRFASNKVSRRYTIIQIGDV
jgi:hypothetical protein